MHDGTVVVDARKGGHFTGSDQRLDVDVPGNAVSDADTAAAGGQLRLTATTDPLSDRSSNTISVTCSAPGTSDAGCYEQTLTVDPLGHQAGGMVDAFGRQVYEQRFTGNAPANYAVYATAKYRYNMNGNLTQVTHPDGTSTTTLAYDAIGRKTQQTNPDTGVRTYGYDQDGNLTSTTDARGSAGTVFAGFDGIDRVGWRNSVNNPTGAFATFTYDSTASGNQGVGRLTGETFTGGPSNSLAGSYAHVYDARGEPTLVTLTVGSTNYPVQTTFDDAGNPLTQTYPTNEVVTTGYTAQGWLSSLSTSQGNTTLLSGVSYAGFGGAAGQLTSASLGGGQYQYTANFDALLRAADLKIANGGTTLFEQSRTYDAAGNVATANTTLPTGTDNQAFCYDEQNRLTWAGAKGTPPCGASLTMGSLTAAQYIQNFSYDTLGRLTSGPLGTYSYGDSAHLHAATAIGSSYTAAYDAAGEMTCRAPSNASSCTGTQSGAQLTYNTEGSLAVWQNTPSNPTSSAGFLYDNQGNRVEQQVTQGGTTTTTTYVGNLEQVWTTGSTTTTTTYYYVGGARIALAVNGTFSYLASDGLGTANVALNSTGTATASTLLAPYGGGRYSAGTMPTDYGFTGQHADAVTGLDYYRARYYDPLAGQFTTADPILPGGGFDILGLSRYAYVEGNPETLTDPSGNEGCRVRCGQGWSGESSDNSVSPPPTYSSVMVVNAQIDYRESPSVAPEALDELNHLRHPSALVQYREEIAYDVWQNFEAGHGVGAGGALLAFMALIAGGTDRFSVEAEGSGRTAADEMVGLTGAYRAELLTVLRATRAGVAQEGGGDLVSVFHGSFNDTSSILEKGLVASRAPTWTTRDLTAAQNAIGPARVAVEGPGRDPGIIEARVPRAEFDRVFAPSERGDYHGFGGGLDTTEIVLRTQEQFDVFNLFIVGSAE